MEPQPPETGNPSPLAAPETRVRGPEPHDGAPGEARELGCLGKSVALAVIAISLGYLVMPNLGIFELLPDALPFVGNLDEAFFTMALVSALAALGINLPFMRRHAARRAPSARGTNGR